MNYFELYPGDYLRDTGHLSLTQHGAFLLLMVAYYGSEKPFPRENDAIFRLTKAINSAEKKAAISVADEFFPVGEDGLRHNARADDEIAKVQERMEGADDRKANDAERKRRSRERRAAMFEQLREAGIVPSFDATSAELIDLVTRHVTVKSHVTVSRDGTATRPQTPYTIRATAPNPDTLPVVAPAKPTEAGRACLLMRQAGCVQTNPSHPSLLAALTEGATPESLANYADLAVKTGKRNPFVYAIAAARGDIAAPPAYLTPQGATTYATPRKLTAVERVTQNVRNARIARGEDPDD